MRRNSSSRQQDVAGVLMDGINKDKQSGHRIQATEHAVAAAQDLGPQVVAGALVEYSGEDKPAGYHMGHNQHGDGDTIN
jgi:hypothetical protein